MPDRCPIHTCGSDRVTKYSQYLENKKSGGGSGCISCLLLIIIFILAPGLVLLFGIIVGAAIYSLRTPIIIAAGIGLVLTIIYKVHQDGLFICEKCGHKFK